MNTHELKFLSSQQRKIYDNLSNFSNLHSAVAHLTIDQLCTFYKETPKYTLVLRNICKVVHEIMFYIPEEDAS